MTKKKRNATLATDQRRRLEHLVSNKHKCLKQKNRFVYKSTNCEASRASISRRMSAKQQNVQTNTMIIHESDVSQQLTIVLGMSDGVDDGSELG